MAKTKITFEVANELVGEALASLQLLKAQVIDLVAVEDRKDEGEK